jgi:hypothetical protein
MSNADPNADAFLTGQTISLNDSSIGAACFTIITLASDSYEVGYDFYKTGDLSKVYPTGSDCPASL